MYEEIIGISNRDVYISVTQDYAVFYGKASK
jgi:hypothetical protein